MYAEDGTVSSAKGQRETRSPSGSTEVQMCKFCRMRISRYKGADMGQTGGVLQATDKIDRLMLSSTTGARAQRAHRKKVRSRSEVRRAQAAECGDGKNG